jgi:hypothetical protein
MDVQKLFANEKWWVGFKSFWIEIARKIFATTYNLLFAKPYVARPRPALDTPAELTFTS